jgi:hypothetical protein
VRRQSARLNDPANGQAAPDHGGVVGVALATDHGDAQGDGFVVAHTNLRTTQRYIEASAEAQVRVVGLL